MARLAASSLDRRQQDAYRSRQTATVCGTCLPQPARKQRVPTFKAGMPRPKAGDACRQIVPHVRPSGHGRQASINRWVATVTNLPL